MHLPTRLARLDLAFGSAFPYKLTVRRAAPRVDLDWIACSGLPSLLQSSTVSPGGEHQLQEVCLAACRRSALAMVSTIDGLVTVFDGWLRVTTFDGWLRVTTVFASSVVCTHGPPVWCTVVSPPTLLHWVGQQDARLAARQSAAD